MVAAIIQYGTAAIVAGIVSFATLLLNRHWKKKDEAESGNKVILNKLSEIEGKLDKHIQEDKMEKAKAARTRILRYNDELLNGTRHSKEMADSCLIDCTYYERACEEIPNFQNNIATMAIANIKRIYAEAMENNSFL